MRFFIDDRDAIAAYARERCDAASREAIAVADDVCEKSFMFTLRWDMERTHEPVRFDGKIDWLHMPKDDPEWIFALNRMRFWICLGQAYALTGDEKYGRAFAEQLTDWVENVRRDDPRCEKAWRSIEAGLRMEYWCKAMAYFDGSPSVTEATRDVFRKSVTEHAEFIMGVWNSYNLMSNWGVLANHGLFVASVCLPQTAQTARWREEALRRLALEIEMQVYDDGSHWEQSPMYHNEVTHDFLDVVILARRNGIKLPEIIERKTHALCRANLAWVKPDGNELCMGDSDDIDARDILSKGAYLWRDGELKAAGYAELDFDCVWDLGIGAAKEYALIEPKEPEALLVSLPDSGNYALRSSWKPDATFLHFHAGTLGAGHGHSDQLHFDLFANGEDILVDAGRLTYVAGRDRYEFKDSTAHNTCLVDGENFYQCKDSWECAGLNRALNRFARQKNGYALLEGGHLGYVSSPKGGVFVNRRIVALSPSLYVVVDAFHGTGGHVYESRLHFDNKGTLALEGIAASYESPRNRAFVEPLTAFGGLDSRIEKSRLSRHYNLAEDNETLCSSFGASGFASLFTVISLGERATAKMVPTRSNFKNVPFPPDQVEALALALGGREWTVVVAHREFASPTDTFLADGCTGFGAVVVFDRTAGEREIGTVLQW